MFLEPSEVSGYFRGAGGGTVVKLKSRKELQALQEEKQKLEAGGVFLHHFIIALRSIYQRSSFWR